MKRGAGRVVGVELRRGAGVWAAAPLALALVAVVLAHPREWAGDWAGWAYYQRTSLLVFGPLVVAVAAWQGGRERRRGLDQLLASTARPQLHRTLASLASPVTWALVSLGLVAAAMAVVTTGNTSYGRPLVGVVLSAAAAVVLFAAVGYAVGRLSPWRVTAPMLALASYVGLAALNYRGDGLAYLSPGVQLFAGSLPARWWPLASTVSFLAAAAAVLLLLAARRRWLAMPALGLAVLAAAPLARVGQAAFVPDRVGEELVCERGGPPVCLTRRHADQLPAVAGEIRAVLAGLDVPDPIVEQRFGPGLGDRTTTGSTLNTLYLGATLHGGADLGVVRRDAAQAALTWNCGDGSPYPPDDDLASVTARITDWIARRPAAPEPPSPLVGRSESEILSLTRAFSAAAAACNLPAARRALEPRP